jgi:hypothetical protein
MRTTLFPPSQTEVNKFVPIFRFFGGASIGRIIAILLLSYSTLTGAQDPIGWKQWKYGAYKEQPFSYPETLSRVEVDGILLSIKSLSGHEITVIEFRSKDKVAVRTCTHGIRKPLMCNAGDIFVYQKIKSKWVEVPDARSLWLQ